MTRDHVSDLSWTRNFCLKHRGVTFDTTRPERGAISAYIKNAIWHIYSLARIRTLQTTQLPRCRGFSALLWCLRSESVCQSQGLLVDGTQRLQKKGKTIIRPYWNHGGALFDFFYHFEVFRKRVALSVLGQSYLCLQDFLLRLSFYLLRELSAF